MVREIEEGKTYRVNCPVMACTGVIPSNSRVTILKVSRSGKSAHAHCIDKHALGYRTWVLKKELEEMEDGK
jgi:hypothetical protein